MTRPNQALGALHDHYVEAVNIAVAEDDLSRVDELVADYEREALALSEAALSPAA